MIMCCPSFQFKKIDNEDIDDVISVFEEIRAELIQEGSVLSPRHACMHHTCMLVDSSSGDKNYVLSLISIFIFVFIFRGNHSKNLVIRKHFKLASAVQWICITLCVPA